MTQVTVVGIDVGGREIALGQLQLELIAGGVPVPNGLTIVGPARDQPTFPPDPILPQGARLFTYDAAGQPADLPPEAGPIVANHIPHAPSADPRVILNKVRTATTLEGLRDAIVELEETRL